MKKIVWAEGVLLGQQHLQQWENYHQSQYDSLLKLISPYSWGIENISWDEKSLLYGQFILTRCDVIFPNGLRVNYDQRTHPTLSYVLTSEHANHEDIYLAIPLSTHVKNITGYSARNGLSGWNGQYECVLDEYDESREREVLFAYPNISLLSSKEDKTSFCMLKIAELRRKNVGEFVIDADFIPACLHINTSMALLTLINHLIEWLSSKIGVLRSGNEFLSLLNMLLAELGLLKNCPSLHPFEFYRWLNRLCGLFIAVDPMVVLPSYNPLRLSELFFDLVQLAKRLLNIAIPSQTTILEWRRETEFLYTARSIESHLFKHAFYFAVTHDLPVMEWLARFTAEIKVGSRSMIESIVASALSGVSVVHVQRPPDNLHIKPGHEYFYIEPNGYFWEQAKTEQNLSLFVSRDFSKAHIELIIVNKDNE
ncbi:MAG: type VI secretion system baseplate subunit TssK [Gammaproteobacteria bacterium]|nr:type VI secretion system baseplate subunit TssK [Gammaproteobacteria bacterium]